MPQPPLLLEGPRAPRDPARPPPKTVVLFASALVLAGGWAATELPLELVPSLELPQLVISAPWPGASARAVERQVAAPIERTLRGISGLGSITSFSREGAASVAVDLGRQRDRGHVTAEVSDRLAALVPSLPPGVRPRLEASVPEALRGSRDFLVLRVAGPGSAADLRRLAEDRLVPPLRSLPGIAEVVVAGGLEEELRIELSPGRLSSHGLAAGEVERAVAERLRPGGHGHLPGVGLWMGEGPPDLVALARLPLRRMDGEETGAAFVRLGDVAELGV
ncbi:MAG: efflux RND transporter permease subunit, partial [Holophagales bacterium]|nr:efflux RND transporter permease subunit [Holophagales bacterium]